MSIGIFIYSLIICSAILGFGLAIKNTMISGTFHAKSGFAIIAFDLILFISLMSLAFSFSSYRHLIESFKHDGVIVFDVKCGRCNNNNGDYSEVNKLIDNMKNRGYELVYDEEYMGGGGVQYMYMIFAKDKLTFSERYDNFMKAAENNN